MKAIPKQINEFTTEGVVHDFLLEVANEEDFTFIQLDTSQYVSAVLYHLLDPTFGETERSKSLNPVFIRAKVVSDSEFKRRIIELAKELQKDQ